MKKYKLISPLDFFLTYTSLYTYKMNLSINTLLHFAIVIRFPYLLLMKTKWHVNSFNPTTMQHTSAKGFGGGYCQLLYWLYGIIEIFLALH